MTRSNPILIVVVLLFSSSGIYAQTYPGGISNNLTLWMIADSATSVSSTNTTLATWKDQKKTNTFTISGTASTITVVKSALNFHSVVRFTGSTNPGRGATPAHRTGGLQTA